MKRDRAQDRMLICAAFFSFGALCGAITLSKLPFAAAESLAALVSRVISTKPLLLVPASAATSPLLLILAGASAFGAAIIGCVCFLSGFALGAVESAAVLLRDRPLIFGAFMLLYALCLIQIGGCMLRRASLVRCRIISAGAMNPDRDFDFASVFSALCVLILSAFTFACYILNS